MADENDKKASAMFREVENRLVWVIAMTVIRATSSGLTERCAKSADDVLDEYQRRFSAIPPDGPPV